MKLFNRMLGVTALAALALFAISRAQNIGPYITRDISLFIKTHADYEELYHHFRPYGGVGPVKDRLPYGSRIKISSPSDELGLRYISIRYAFYPCIVSDDWDYFVDFDQNGPPPGTSSALHFTNAISIYAKPGHAFSREHTEHIPLFSPQLLFFATISLWLVLLGALFLRGMGFAARPGERGWFYSTSYLTGVLVSASSLWLLMLTPFKISLPAVNTLVVVLTAAAVAWSRRKPSRAHPPLPPAPAITVTTAGTRWLDRAALGFLLVMITIILSFPINVWDEMLIWIIKARHFYQHQGLDFSYTANTNNYYPLLWPLHNTFHFFFLGDHDEIAKWASALAYTAFLLQLRGMLLFAGVDRRFGWGLTALYVVLFHHWSFRTALPENLLMAFMTAMTACVLRRLKPGGKAPAFLPLALLMAAGLALVKFEGAAIAFLCAASLLAQGRSMSWRPGDMVCAAGCIGVMLLPWAWLRWAEASGVNVSCYHLAGKFDLRNVVEMASMVWKFFLGNDLLYLLAALVLSFPFWGRRALRTEERFLGLMALGLAALALSGGLFWPAADFQKYYAEVFTRLIVRVTPALTVLWVSLLLTRMGPPGADRRGRPLRNSDRE